MLHLNTSLVQHSNLTLSTRWLKTVEILTEKPKKLFNFYKNSISMNSSTIVMKMSDLIKYLE